MIHQLKINIEQRSDVNYAVFATNDYLRNLELSKKQLSIVSIIISELASNIHKYAKKGNLIVKATNDKCITIVAEDFGPGMKDFNLVMTDGYSTGGTLGLGLPSVKRLSDSVEFENARSSGTKITVTKCFK